MSDYGGDISDYDYDSDGDWLFVEDHYDDIDSLAEHTCPSPLPSGVEIDTTDYDPYDYWQDITYLSDGYDGTRTSRRKNAPTLHDRAPKYSVLQEPLITWMSKQECERILDHAKFADLGSLRSVSLLKDWKERFKSVPGLSLIANTGFGNDPTGISEGKGVDLGDIRAVAELLSQDSMDTLKNILKERGLDSDALDVVLQDLLDGREPDFEMDEEGEHDFKEEEGAEKKESFSNRSPVKVGASTETAHSAHSADTVTQIPASRKRSYAELSSEAGRITTTNRENNSEIRRAACAENVSTKRSRRVRRE